MVIVGRRQADSSDRKSDRVDLTGSQEDVVSTWELEFAEI